MFSTTPTFTTLFAAIAAVSAATNATAPLVVNKPANLTQCANTVLSWTGGSGPYNVWVFTDCKDDNDDPIATFTNVTGNSVNWWVSQTSGSGIFTQVEDATGTDEYSEDAYVGGDAGAKASACAASVSALSTASVASATASSSGSVPTTMSNANKVNANGVANAAGAPTVSAAVVTGSAISTPNGAITLSARPAQIGAGLLALAFAAML